MNYTKKVISNVRDYCYNEIRVRDGEAAAEKRFSGMFILLTYPLWINIVVFLSSLGYSIKSSNFPDLKITWYGALFLCVFLILPNLYLGMWLFQYVEDIPINKNWSNRKISIARFVILLLVVCCFSVFPHIIGTYFSNL